MIIKGERMASEEKSGLGLNIYMLLYITEKAMAPHSSTLA